MKNEQNQFLGKKLFKLRKYYGLTQKECVDALGLKCQQDYSDLELGSREFDEGVISRIASFFKISKEDFISLQNMETFPFLLNYRENEGKSKPIPRNEILEVLILRKQLLEKELKIIQLEQQLTKRTYPTDIFNYRDTSSIYVFI